MAELIVTPKKGDKDTVFDFRGSGYEPGKVLAIDFGDDASSSVTVSEDGHWHINYRYGISDDYDVSTKYVGDEKNLDQVAVKVS